MDIPKTHLKLINKWIKISEKSTKFCWTTWQKGTTHYSLLKVGGDDVPVARRSAWRGPTQNHLEREAAAWRLDETLVVGFDGGKMRYGETARAWRIERKFKKMDNFLRSESFATQLGFTRYDKEQQCSSNRLREGQSDEMKKFGR